MGLVLTELDTRWGLGLRIPEIPAADFEQQPLAALLNARLKISVGSESTNSISALDLRPGVGAAIVDVLPSLQRYRTSAEGSWPASINQGKWDLEARGLSASGVLFRLSGARWARLPANSGVLYGETLLILSDQRCVVPKEIIVCDLGSIRGDGFVWSVTEIQIPESSSQELESWISKLGHELTRRPWSLQLLTPPRALSSDGQPDFWVGDFLAIAIKAPERNAEAIVTVRGSINASSHRIKIDTNGAVFVQIGLRSKGVCHVEVVGQRNAALALRCVDRPEKAPLINAARDSQALSIRIGQQLLKGWDLPTRKTVSTAKGFLPPQVTIGDVTNRAGVTTWLRGKRKQARGLDSDGVEKILVDALRRADRVAVDAGNLGRLEMVPSRAVLDPARGDSRQRLDWWCHLMNSIPSATNGPQTKTVLARPKFTQSLVVNSVNQVALIRSRMAVRRRNLAKRGSQ